MWGANAVNGVINIITKSSTDTLGTLLTVSSGNYERFHGQARFGATIGEETSYRLYGKYLDRAEGEDSNLFKGEDSWQMGQTGFRVDHALSAKNQLTIQGDMYKAELDDVNLAIIPPLSLAVPTKSLWDMRGYHILGEWQYSMAKDSSLQAQFYYDNAKTDSLFGNEDRDTIDFDFQHIFPLGTQQSISWGVGYRLSSDEIEGTYQVSNLYDNSSNESIYSAFLQDEITLFHPSLKFIIGSKFEHNDYTGFEIQPNVRSSWQPADNHSLWVAISRAVRTPSRYEYDGQIRSPLVIDPEDGTMSARVWQSSTDFVSETLVAYEAGYRHIASKKLSFDLALFYNDYEELKTVEPSQETTLSTSVGDIQVQTYTVANNSSGSTWGGELVANFLPTDWWRMQGVYSYLQMHLKNDGDSGDDSEERKENTSPGSQLSVRSFMQFPHNLSLNLWLRYVGALSSENTDAYWDGDVRVAWEPIEQLELSLVGQNLFHESRKEIEQLSYFSLSTEVERSVYLKLSWRY